jgi:hypothetical protein
MYSFAGWADRTRRNARVVERTIDATESRNRLRYHIRYIGFLCDVALDRDGLTTGCADQADSRLRTLL